MSMSLAVFFGLASLHAPQVAPETLAAFAQAESALDPLCIHDNTTGRSFTPRSLDEAINLAYELMRESDDLDLGLLAINQRNMARLGLTVSSAFDPVLSIKAGARVIVENYRQCMLTLQGEAALKCMASYYNTGSATAGLSNGYVAHLWRIADQIVPAIRDARQLHLQLPDAPPPPTEDGDFHDAVAVHPPRPSDPKDPS